MALAHSEGRTRPRRAFRREPGRLAGAVHDGALSWSATTAMSRLLVQNSRANADRLGAQGVDIA
jgi:hypothetical protein